MEHIDVRWDEVFDRYSQGESMREIAKDMGISTPRIYCLARDDGMLDRLHEEQEKRLDRNFDAISDMLGLDVAQLHRDALRERRKRE